MVNYKIKGGIITVKRNDSIFQTRRIINRLIAFYIFIPAAYLGYVLITIAQTNSTYHTYLNSNAVNPVLFLTAIICFIWAYLIWKLKELKQYTLLKKLMIFITVSQLLLGNLLGAIFTIITRIKTKAQNDDMNEKKSMIQCKLLTIINILLTFIVVAAYSRIYL